MTGRGPEERGFWEALEFRVSRELHHLPAARALGLWCDGFTPREYVLRGPGRHVAGDCWIGLGDRDQQEWTFRFFLEDHIPRREDIPWERFLPPEDHHGWLSFDPRAKHLDMRPPARPE